MFVGPTITASAHAVLMVRAMAAAIFVFAYFILTPSLLKLFGENCVLYQTMTQRMSRYKPA
jgi:hypothetical protein